MIRALRKLQPKPARCSRSAASASARAIARWCGNQPITNSAAKNPRNTNTISPTMSVEGCFKSVGKECSSATGAWRW